MPFVILRKVQTAEKEPQAHLQTTPLPCPFASLGFQGLKCQGSCEALSLAQSLTPVLSLKIPAPPPTSLITLTSTLVVHHVHWWLRLHSSQGNLSATTDGGRAEPISVSSPHILSANQKHRQAPRPPREKPLFLISPSQPSMPGPWLLILSYQTPLETTLIAPTSPISNLSNLPSAVNSLPSRFLHFYFSCFPINCTNCCKASFRLVSGNTDSIVTLF